MEAIETTKGRRATLREAFSQKYPKYVQILNVYEQANLCSADWENITKVNLSRFADELQNRVARNTAKYYCAMLKSVLSLYSDEVELPKDYAKVLSVKGEASVSTWLNEKEIEKIVAYEPHSDTERIVKSQFILGCLTGARYSDYSRFTAANITDGKIVYVSQKTKIKAEIPLSEAAERIILNGSAIGEVTLNTFNTTIRTICYKSGIRAVTQVFHKGEEMNGEKWRFVTSHTARKSFATNVYLRCRDIFLVSQYMGHSSVDMTATYILSVGDAPEAVKKYFERFK